MAEWFTADWHLQHEKIISYCNRPFKNLERMEHTLIQRHNRVVKPGDTVYHLGDFIFRTKPNSLEYYLDKLNGRFVFIKGNHDETHVKSHLIAAIIRSHGRDFYLTHDPDAFNINYEINLVGHVHEKWKILKVPHPSLEVYNVSSYLINVGVDQWNFTPVNLNTILSLLEHYKKWHKSLESERAKI